MGPFDTPAQAILDFTRIVVFVGGVVLIAIAWYVPFTSKRARSTPTYPYTTIALSLYTLMASVAELQRLGKDFTWHLAPKLVALVFAFFALYRTSVFASAPERWD